jgi:hypothetical protein
VTTAVAGMRKTPAVAAKKSRCRIARTRGVMRSLYGVCLPSRVLVWPSERAVNRVSFVRGTKGAARVAAVTNASWERHYNA